MRSRRQLRASGHRRDPLWLAFMVHRLSGLALACFLPLHFLMLGLAIDGGERLDGALRWTANPLVKVAEMGLVFLLTVHLLGGIRVLAIENLPWGGAQKKAAAAAFLIAGLAAIAFLVHWG